MRIAQICPYSLSVPGGVQGQVLGLTHALRDKGHEARVLAPCDGPPPDPLVTPLGKSVPTAVNGSMAPIAPDPACALRTIHALHNEGYDVIHLHEPAVPGPTLTALLVADVPTIGTFHAAGNKTGYMYFSWLAKRAVRKLDAKVAVSKEALITAEQNIGGEFHTLFNGIEVDRYAYAEPYQKSERTIFFVGRHEQRKGLEVLLDALSKLPDDIDLWIAGQGPQTSSLKSATSNNERVKWLGVISEREKIARLRSADIFCAPSIDGESFGVVLLEAMAARTPIVASDLPGYRSVARTDDEAVFVGPGDSTSLAEGIVRVFDDPSIADRLRINGTNRADQFSMSNLADSYLEIYEQLIR